MDVVIRNCGSTAAGAAAIAAAKRAIALAEAIINKLAPIIEHPPSLDIPTITIPIPDFLIDPDYWWDEQQRRESEGNMA